MIENYTIIKIIEDYLIGKGIDKGIDLIKYMLYEIPQKRCLKTLIYATNGDEEKLKELFKKIETDEKFREKVYDIFEVARRTQSVLAIKTLSLIFGENQDDENMKQKACRAFAEISDETIEFFLKLFKLEKEKKDENRNYIIYDENIDKFKPYNREDIKYFIFDLKSRGFIIDSNFNGGGWKTHQENFRSLFALTKFSDIYKEKIQKAKTIKDKIPPITKLSATKKQNDK